MPEPAPVMTAIWFARRAMGFPLLLVLVLVERLVQNAGVRKLSAPPATPQLRSRSASRGPATLAPRRWCAPDTAPARTPPHTAHSSPRRRSGASTAH